LNEYGHQILGFKTVTSTVADTELIKRSTKCPRRDVFSIDTQTNLNDLGMNDKTTSPIWFSALEGHDIVIISPQYWGDYWVSKHWIAYELSRRLRTVFVEPPIWLSGMAQHPWVTRAHVHKVFRPLRKVDDDLYIFSPKMLPRILEPRGQDATSRTVDGLRGMGIQRPIVLNFGTNYDLVRRIEGTVTVYYCVDPAFPEPGHENDEALTCQGSDLVYAVSETYRQQLSAFCAPSQLHVIPHGYAFEHARRVAEDQPTKCPAELQALPRPILGFVGSIHDAYVDIERVERLAKRRPGASIVLIGPYQNNPLGPDLSSAALKRLRRLPNVHLLGPRHFLDVPQYVKFFDVCLVLVNVKDYDGSAMTSKRTHFKWLAYLSMGKPVVAPWVHEADSISTLVYLAADNDAYDAAIDSALEEDSALAMPRISYASQFAFDKTLASIAQPIAQVLNSRVVAR
jgi:glycosyltransferase involved in cell wall biosynthesis